MRSDPFTPSDLVIPEEFQPDPLPAYPDSPALDPDFQEAQPEPEAILAQPAACKICRGQAIELVFDDSTPYTTHIRQVHPDSI